MAAAFAVVALAALAGCGGRVNHTVSDDLGYADQAPVAVMPVEWVEGDERKDEAANLLRDMAAEKLRLLNYSTLDLEETDAVLGADGGEMGPAAVAEATGARGVLYTTVTEWDEDRFVTYAALDISATFELYSPGGALLWRARHSIGESDLRLDSQTRELAAIETYEPILQRFVDIVFSTLPANETRAEEKRYFDWLP